MSELDEIGVELDRITWHQKVLAMTFLVLVFAWCFVTWYLWRKGVPFLNSGGTLIGSAFASMLAISQWNNTLGIWCDKCQVRLERLHRENFVKEQILLVASWHKNDEDDEDEP